MSKLDERMRREAEWSQTVMSCIPRYWETDNGGQLNDVGDTTDTAPDLVDQNVEKLSVASTSDASSQLEFVLAHTEANPKLVFALVARRHPEIFDAERMRDCEVRVTRRAASTIRFECRTGTYEARVDKLFLRDGVGDWFAVLASTPELIVVGRGGSESEALAAAIWSLEEQLDTAFLRAKFGKPPPADAPEVVRWNRWRDEQATFVGKSNVVFRSFYGQLVSRNDGAILLRWTDADEDDMIDVVGIPGSHLLKSITTGDWFTSRVIQRIDNFQLTAILDVVPGRPPRTGPLSDQERMALKAKFVDLRAEY